YSYYFFVITSTPTLLSSLSLHDALPIYLSVAYRQQPSLGLESAPGSSLFGRVPMVSMTFFTLSAALCGSVLGQTLEKLVSALKRSEEHTSELQSLRQIVCRLLLEQKKLS